MPVIDPFKEIIDTILLVYSLLPRKQRHIGVKVYRIIHDNHGYQGCLRSVTAYISKHRNEMQSEIATAYQRLDHQYIKTENLHLRKERPHAVFH